jgi:hypothetical protein
MTPRWTIAVLLCAVPARGRAEPEVELGAKAGPIAATLDHEFRENRYGFSGGLTGLIRHALGARFSFGEQLELLYTQRGAEVVVDGVTQGESRQHYLDVTLTAHPGMQFGAWNAYLLLGGSVNILLSANKNSPTGFTEDITEFLRRYDVALVGGIGVAWHLPPGPGPFRLGAISLEARHDIGLVDSDKTNDGFKNRSSSLLLGVSFAIGDRAAPEPPTQSAQAAR